MNEKMNCKHKIVKIFACGALIMKKTYFTVDFLAAIRKFVYIAIIFYYGTKTISKRALFCINPWF